MTPLVAFLLGCVVGALIVVACWSVWLGVYVARIVRASEWMRGHQRGGRVRVGEP